MSSYNQHNSVKSLAGMLAQSSPPLGIGSQCANVTTSPPITLTANGAINSVNVKAGYPSLTTAQLTALNATSFPLGQVVGLHPAVKKYEVFETPIDILALSVTWKRLRDNGHSDGVYKLLDAKLFDKVTSADNETADKIRDYYHKKIMMFRLRTDRELTRYRNDLVKFIQSNGLIVKEELLGLAYYLPIFYQYDINLDEVRSEVDINQNFKKLDKEGKPKVLSLSTNLSPLKRIVRKTRSKTINQYWFKDTVLNAGVLINLQPNNPLEHMWEDTFNSNKVLKIKGSYQRCTLDNFEYFCVDKWQLDKG